MVPCGRGWSAGCCSATARPTRPSHRGTTMTSIRDFEGAVAIVTGGSTGLGRSIAEEVARRGARAVAINFIGEEKDGEEAAAAVRALGAEAVLVPGDIGEEDVCRALVASVARYERVDALFNNAGTTK